MNPHLTADTAERLRRGTLSPAELAAIGRHIATCAPCRAMAGAATPIDRGVRDLQILIEAEESDALYAAGEESAPSLLRYWPVAAALVLLAGIGIWFRVATERRPVPPPAPVVRKAPAGYGNPSWNDAVAHAITTGALTLPPQLLELQAETTQLRGPEAVDEVALSPNGEIVEETTPQLEWTVRTGSTYTLLMAHGNEVTEHETGTTAAWRPAKPLARGAEYTWQVVYQRGGASELHPAAPRPPARFRVLSEEGAAELAEARRRFPHDHLLLAVLLARNGVRPAAKAELGLLRATRPSLAERLLSSLYDH